MFRVRVFYGVGQRHDFMVKNKREAQSLSTEISTVGMRIETESGAEEILPVRQIVRITIDEEPQG